VLRSGPVIVNTATALSTILCAAILLGWAIQRELSVTFALGDLRFCAGAAAHSSGILWSTHPDSFDGRILAPHWVTLPLFAALPAIRLISRRLNRPTPPGHCPTCGYDLRATPSRCPECGWKPWGWLGA